MKPTIIIVIIAALITAAGFWLFRDYFLPDRSNNNSNQVNQPLNNQSTGGQSNPDDFFQYLAGLSASDKKKIKESDQWQILLKIQAGCNRLTGQQQQDCLTDMNINQIVILNKAELCAAIPKADECYFNLAVNNLNEDLCASINDQEVKKECNYLINESRALNQTDLSFCDRITDEVYKQDCYLGVIGKKNDLSFCDSAEIRERNLSDRCRALVNSRADDNSAE